MLKKMQMKNAKNTNEKIPLGVAFNVCTAVSSEAFSRLTSFTHANWSPGSRPPFNAAGLPGTRLLIIITVSSSFRSCEEEEIYNLLIFFYKG